jgi:malonyl-CoA O-methyltransferase
MHDIGDALIRAGFGGPVLDVERFTLTYTDVLDLMRDLKLLGAVNVAQDRRRTLTGKGKLARVLSAYEAYRCEGRLPATYEVVYGHAWVPEPGQRRQDGSTVASFPVDALRGSRRRRGPGG